MVFYRKKELDYDKVVIGFSEVFGFNKWFDV